jgi:hypothetical protein
LKIYSTITLSCTTAFLEDTETVVSTTRTETVARKEDLLRYMISACKVQHGKTSNTVIRYSKILAKLHVSIHEEQKAEGCWKVLHKIRIARYGKGSAEETSISGHLKIVLKKGEKHGCTRKLLNTRNESLTNSITVLDLWSERHIKTIRELEGACEKRGELLKTEEYYVTLWSRWIEHYHQIRTHSVDADVHLSIIDISLEYVHFLRRHHRHEEAAGVVICIWAEHEEYTFKSEIIFLRLKKIGELMRATSLLSIANQSSKSAGHSSNLTESSKSLPLARFSFRRPSSKSPPQLRQPQCLLPQQQRLARKSLSGRYSSHQFPSQQSPLRPSQYVKASYPCT